MKNRHQLVFVVLMFVAIVGCYAENIVPPKPQTLTAVSSPEDVGFSASRLARIDSLFDYYVKSGIMPNANLFIARHGKIVYSKTFGYKNLEKKIPLKKDDIFRIASQSKVITTVGLMTLYEEGRFMLDEPISKYILEFRKPTVLEELNKKDTTYTARPAKREITIRDLLTHTSGLDYGGILYDKSGIPSFNSLDKITIGEMVKELAKLPLIHDPGESFTYGLNLDVLGYLIEVLSGKPLDKFLKERVLDPLGMKDTYFYLPKEKADRLVTLYSNDSIGGRFYPCKDVAFQTFPVAGAQTYFSGGAGMVGTIEDYAHLCQMFLNGGIFNGHQVLGRKTIELMTSDQLGDVKYWDSRNTFGLGFEITREKGAGIIPGSVGTYKWGGMYSTDFVIDPKEDMFSLIYSNAEPFSNPDINKLFRVMVYQALVN